MHPASWFHKLSPRLWVPLAQLCGTSTPKKPQGHSSARGPAPRQDTPLWVRVGQSAMGRYSGSGGIQGELRAHGHHEQEEGTAHHCTHSVQAEGSSSPVAMRG